MQPAALQSQENQLKTPICCICSNKCKHAQRLVCCHATVCKSCFQEWRKKQNICPACSKPLSKHKTKKYCRIHNKEFEYYCQTCNEPLCSDCLLEQLQSQTGKHTGHPIIKMAEKDKVSRNSLETYLQTLRTVSDKIQNKASALQKQQNELNVQKRDLKDQTSTNFNYLARIDLENHYQQILEEYRSKTSCIQTHITDFQSALEESEMIIKSSDSKVVPLTDKNISKLQNLQDKINFLPIHPLPITNKLKPPFETMQIRIPCYQTVINNIRSLYQPIDYIFSEEKDYFGCIWRAKIYPNGTLQGKGTHLGVYVELLKGTQLPAYFLYQIDIASTNRAAKSISRKFTSQFNPMDSWGWNRVLLIDSVIENYLDHEGALTLYITIGPSTFSYAISHKTHEYEQLVRKCKKLKNLYENEIKRLQQSNKNVLEGSS